MAKRLTPKDKPPEPDELELSLFGPGIGECVVVHIGRNEWMVIDSCLSESQGRAIALDYFDSLGVDPSCQVKLIVVTHWHDDHIRGAAELFRASSSARFSCPAALRHREFFTLVHAGAATKLVQHTSGVSEFSDILEELKARAGSGAQAGPDIWAQDGMRLLQMTGGIEVHALRSREIIT
jgi:glyoxylase-like metal-dependent hydrolase (beta-lactamase superfamily II)